MLHQLKNWVALKESNGIKQHSEEWHKARVCTIGGSSIAVIQGKSPYSDIPTMLGQKIGLHKFQGNIMTQYGNLFEDVIKRYVEIDKSCEILGEDLFVEGSHGMSYSPDGLTVLTINSVEQIVLVEFKCPYSRIPTGKIPSYYIPQVKMGLEILELPTIGLFVEGVFRRCTWDQLGDNPHHEIRTATLPKETLPLAYGVIGFYCETINDAISQQYIEHFLEYGNETNQYMCNDLGDAPSDLFAALMNEYDRGVIKPWYGSIQHSGEQKMAAVCADVEAFTSYCAANGFVNLGVLPWKLFNIEYNYVEKTKGYLEPWLPKIQELVEVVKKCVDPANSSIKTNIYTSYINGSHQCGFSDDF